MDPGHLCPHTITREETQPRLNFWHPFATSGKDLLSTTLSNETKTHWIARMWSAEWQPSTSRLHEYITSPSRSSPGSALPQQAWVKPNRVGVGRFNADNVEMGLIQESSLQLRCRPADSKSHHHRVPLYHPPNGLHGLIDIDADAASREWLLSKVPRDLFLLAIRFHTQEEEVYCWGQVSQGVSRG